MRQEPHLQGGLGAQVGWPDLFSGLPCRGEVEVVFGMEVCVIGWVASRACYIGVIGLSEGGPATRDLPGTNSGHWSCDCHVTTTS